MKYISTRGKAPVLNFEEAMLTGLARDGGLYVPQSIPNFSPDDISSMSDLSYEEIAFKVILPFVGDCFSCLLYTSPSPRDATLSRMPSSA